MKKGSVWYVDLLDGQGHEQKGQRPAIVVGNANGLVTIIPLTTSADRAILPYTHVINPTKENGLMDNSVALVFQLKSLDKTRFRRRIGEVTKEDLKALDGLLADMLCLRQTP